jgi:hypothetical protein
MKNETSRLAVAAFSAALLLYHPFAAQAQVSEARKQMENARKLFTMSVDAITAGKFADAKTPLEDLRANVILITEKQLQEKYERTLHEKDRSILLPKMKELYAPAGKVKTQASFMAMSLDNAANSSALRELRDGWRDFDDAFKRFSQDFDAYWAREMKELQDRVKRFQEVCGRDCS